MKTSYVTVCLAIFCLLSTHENNQSVLYDLLSLTLVILHSCDHQLVNSKFGQIGSSSIIARWQDVLWDTFTDRNLSGLRFLLVSPASYKFTAFDECCSA